MKSSPVFLLARTIPFALCVAAATANDWNRRIDDALKQTGSVMSVANQLANTSDASPSLNDAKVRVALEEGHLSSALALLLKATLEEPADTARLQQLSQVQAMLGLTDDCERTLNRALASTDHRAIKSSITLKLATLALDTGRTAEGVALLDRLATGDPTIAGQAGMVATLFGQNQAAMRYLNAADHSDITLQFLAGNAALNAGDTDNAKTAFTQAFNAAVKPGDRSYAQERLIASARESGTMGNLADQWLADAQLPSQRLLPLASMLRDLGRVDDLLKLWRMHSSDPLAADVVNANRFINEVLGAAKSAGRTDDAVAVCRELLVHDPDNQQWLTAIVRTLLSEGKSTEADAVLAERVNAAADDPVRLLEIGRLARTLHRDEVAIDAARKIAEFGGVQRINGQLLEASIWQRAGDPVKVSPLLKLAESEAAAHPSAIDAVAGALDTAGLDEDAILLLRQGDQTNLPTDRLNLLASLELNQHRPGEAIASLERILHSPSSKAVRSQAGQRLIDAATQAKSLKDLIDRTRARITSGHGDDQDLSLLVSAFLQKKDVASAVAALKQTSLLDKTEKLRRLAVLYLRQKDLPQAQQTLRELVGADPANAAETLERLASVQLAMNQMQEAVSTIHEIEARIGNSPASSELMAGVFDRLGRSGDAAGEYRRALAITPDRTSDWLLWATATAKAGDADGARHRLQLLCSEAADDNLFSIAVDGLLNLRSPPLVLREVRRQAILRLAQRPRTMILYYVLSDLSDELADPAAVAWATEASVAANDETRPQRLRELMDVASQKGMVDTAIACGRSLVALGDEFPPQLYFQLGEQLLVRNQLANASRTFARAAEEADADMAANRAGVLLEKYDYPVEALNTLLPLLDRNRRDADYVRSVARLEEITNRTDAAFAHYLKVIELTFVSLAADQTPLEHQNPGTGGTYLVMDSSRLLDTFNQSVVGAIATARSLAQRQQLIDALQSNLNQLAADPTISAPTTFTVGMTGALRQAAFALGRPDVADHADAEMIARWPGSKPLKSMAVDARLHDGFYERALSAADTYKVPEGPALHAAGCFLNAGSLTPTTMPGSMSVEAAADLLPALVLRGKLDEARIVLRSVVPAVEVPPEITPSYGLNGPTSSPVKVMIQTAALLQDDKLASQWALLWLDSIGRCAPSQLADAGKNKGAASFSDFRTSGLYARLISTIWRLLSPEAQSMLARQMCDQVSQLPMSVAGPRTILCALQVAASMDDPIDTTKLVNQLFDCSGDVSATAAKVFNLLAGDRRPAFIASAMERLPASTRLNFLLMAVGQAATPLDADAQAAMIAAADALQAGQIISFSNSWCTNCRQASVLKSLTNAVLRSAPDVSGLVQVAVGFSVAGDFAHADGVALQVIDLLAAQPAISASHDATAAGSKMRPAVQLDRAALLRTVIAAMSKPARLDLLHRAISQVNGNSVWRDLLCSTLLDSLGRRDEALVALGSAYIPNPADTSIARAYAARLEADGRTADVAQTLAYKTMSNDGDGPNQRKTLSRALVSLFRWREVRATGGDFDPGAFTAPDFMIPTAAGDSAGLASAFAEMLQQVRNIHGNLPLIQTANAGGLLPHFSPSLPPPVAKDLAQWPGALENLLVAIHLPASSGGAMVSDAPDWLATAVVQAAADPSACQRIVQRLQVSATSGTLTPGERKAIALLAMKASCGVSDSLLASLWPAAAADASGVELGFLADALVARQAPNANIIRRWADILQGGSPPLPMARVKPNERLSPTPVDSLTDDGLAGWLEHVLADRSANRTLVTRQMDRLQSSGQIGPQFFHCDLIRARLAAEAGNVGEYQDRLRDIVGLWAWSHAMRSDAGDTSAITFSDITQSLPATSRRKSDLSV